MSAIVPFRSKGSADGLLLSALMDACAESLAVAEGGRILYANQAFAGMFGHQSGLEVKGRRLDDFVPDACMPVARMPRASRAGQSADVQLFTFTRPPLNHDGDAIHLEGSCSRLHFQGRSLLMVSTHDVSQRWHVEQQLAEAQKMEMVGRLLGGVAHDFNNLLTGIMLYCDLLVAGLVSDPHLRHHAEEIRLAGEHGAALVQQLLTVARQQVIEPQDLCWNKIISGTRNLLSRLIGEDIELSTSLAADLGMVRLDAANAQQIILNLVLNARDAMPRGGPITVSTRNGLHSLAGSVQSKSKRSACVELIVSDTGCGMDPATRARALDVFFTTKKAGEGSGLGLATVDRIVKEAGGAIEIESEPGKGTCVVVRFPRAKENTKSVAASRRLPSESRQTILLVEDNAAVRESACPVLSTCGYTVLEARSGFEAVRVCQSHEGAIDLLLTDLNLPGMNGQAVAKQVRLLRPKVCFLYMSGQGQQPPDTVDAEQIVVFRKPFTATALLDKVTEILDQNEKRGKSI